MRLSQVIVAVSAVVTGVSGCVSTSPDYAPFDYYRALCGDSEKPVVEWNLARNLPKDIATLRELADVALAASGSSIGYPVESWFSRPSGEVMLCRTDSCSGDWWAFRKQGETWVIFDSSAWVCVT